MSIISVRLTIRGESCEERVSHVIGEEILQFPCQFMQHTKQLARDLLRLDQFRITYLDSEGDACTLTEETVKDAVCFTTPGSHDEHMRVLELEVSPTEATETPLPADSAAEVQESKATETPAQQSHEGHLPCHYGVSCDGCNQNPIKGTRYRSQEWHDYDLCRQCYERSDRAEALGVLPDHKFKLIETHGGSNSTSWVDGMLDRLEQDPTAFFQQFLPMVDVQQMLPQLAQVGVEVVAGMDKEELFPLLDPLTNLAEQNPVDMASLPAHIRAIAAVIRVATQQTQDELKQRCMAGGMRLFCTGEAAVGAAGAAGAAGFGQFHPPGWMKGMFKGMFKGKGKGKGMFKGKGKGMFAGMGKGMCKGDGECEASEAQESRENLACASPSCTYRVHSNSKFGSYCCKSCKMSPGTHGPCCEQRLALDGATRASPEAQTKESGCCWGKEFRRGKRHWSCHRSFVCDGCGQNPITGTRYRSQEWHDYDLCAQCYERSDRADTLGVLSDHKFTVIEGDGGSSSTSWVDGMLDRLEEDPTAFFQQHLPMVDVQQMLPKLAQVGMEVVAGMDKEELFPLLEPLTNLAEQNPVDMGSLPAQIRAIVTIIQAAPQQIQYELKQRCMASGMRWLMGMLFKGKGMCKGKGKGMFKGKGDGAGDGMDSDWWKSWAAGWGGKCGKGFGKRGWCGDGESHGWFEGCSKRARKEHEGASVHDAAMSSLLAHPDAKIREAAQQALQQATNACDAANPSPHPSSAETVPPYTAPATEPTPYIESAMPTNSPVLSAVLNSEPAVEIHSDAISLVPLETRDITDEWGPILSQFDGMKKAFLLARVFLDSGASHPSVMAVHFALGNDGSVSWPVDTTLRIAAGNPLGCELVSAGDVPTGSVLEVTLKLDLPSGIDANRSAWALESGGSPFGPMLILEVLRS